MEKKKIRKKGTRQIAKRNDASLYFRQCCAPVLWRGSRRLNDSQRSSVRACSRDRYFTFTFPGLFLTPAPAREGRDWIGVAYFRSRFFRGFHRCAAAGRSVMGGLIVVVEPYITLPYLGYLALLFCSALYLIVVEPPPAE